MPAKKTKTKTKVYKTKAGRKTKARPASKDTILIRDRVYVPIHLVNKQEIQDVYTRRLYDEKACKTCEHLPERHGYLCDTCPAFVDLVKLYKTTIKNDIPYIGIPIGDKRNFENVTGLDPKTLVFKDNRVSAPFDYKIKFLATLRDYQAPVIEKFLKKKYGMLEAPPRTGKCVTGETLVFTEKGIVPIRSLFTEGHLDGEAVRSDLKLLTRNGVESISHLYKKRVDVTLRVTTTNGYTVRGTENHPLLVLDPNMKMEWRNLEDMQEGDVLCINKATSLWATTDYAIPDCVERQHPNAVETSLELPTHMTPELSRFLGYLVANGSLTTSHNQNSKWFSFCTQNKKIQKDFVHLVAHLFGYSTSFDKSGTPTAKIASVYIIEFLERCGLAFTRAAGKVIPESVLRSTREVVLAFFNAYLSCDSYLAQGQAIELCTASKTLGRQLHVVLLNFGIVGKLFSHKSWARNSRTPKIRTYYSIKLTSRDKALFLNTFSLLKKTKIHSIVNIGSHDTIPGLGYRIKSLFNRYHVGSSVYSIKGQRVFPKGLPGSGKHGVNAIPDDLYRKSTHKINKATLSLLEPKLGARIDRALDSEYFFDRITQIKRIEKPVTVYDVSVPGSHSFIANGIVSHNTLMALYICLKLGQKVLVLASQHEFLSQFIDHIQGNPDEEIPQCTNLPELQEKHKKKLYGVPKTDEDFKNFQFFTCTYQQFLSEGKGKDRFRRMAKLVGTIFIDEVHKSSADGFARVVGMFPTKYKFGVTATVKRKDGRHFIAKAIIGPVVARSKRESLIPTVIVHQTEAAPKARYEGKPGWVRSMQFLSRDKKRNALIVEWVMKDLKNGHNIVIPVMFKAHAQLLMDLINAAWGSPICEQFVGGTGARNKEQRKAVLSRAKSNATRVVVGIRSILQLGLNVPTWSAIYTALPISNESNYQQETSRVRTPLEGKRNPIIRVFVDMKLGQSLGCARNCLRHLAGFGYAFKKGEKQDRIIHEIRSSGRRSAAEEEDDLFKGRPNLGLVGPAKKDRRAAIPAKRLALKRL